MTTLVLSAALTPTLGCAKSTYQRTYHLMPFLFHHVRAQGPDVAEEIAALLDRSG